MSTVKKLFNGSIAQTLHMLIMIGIGVVMLPFMISQLGESLYGMWIMIGGLTATLYLFDFGFASAVTRYMAKHIHQNDVESANRTVNSALVIYTGLAGLVVATTAVIAAISSIWVNDPNNIDLVRILIVIAGLTLAVEFPFKAFAGISSAYVRYDLMAWSKIIIRLCATLSTIWALLAGYKLIAIALVQLGASIVGSVVYAAIAFRLHESLRIGIRYVDATTMRTLINYSGWTFVIDLSRLAKEKAPIFFVAAYLGTSTLTVYYVAVRLVEYALQLLTKATGMSTPIFSAYHAKDDMDGLKEKLAVFLRINFLLGMFAVFGLVLLGEPLIRLWMGSSFPYTDAYGALVILICGKIASFIFAPLGSVLLAISRHRWQAFLGLGEISASLVIIFLGLAFFEAGLIAAALGASVPILIGRCLFLPWIINREIHYGIDKVYGELLLPSLLIGLAFIISTLLLRAVTVTTLFDLLLFGVIISAVYWILSLLCLKPVERKYLVSMLPKKFSTFLPKRFLKLG
ncbi:MAG: hypothetical protein CL583_05185 [Alteromonadaceae bacterium]|nr:hypothetical protein [Alteromonadaceae bacterium]|tara:strand:- start:7583 stop:9130 length:1548 start_codon:yes stop_codon:yes gene_type:complete